MAESRTLPRIALWVALLAVIAMGWHYLCVGRMQTDLDLWATDFAQKNPGSSINVEMHPFTNLVEVRLTYKAKGLAGSLATGILVLAQERLESTWERDLKVKARENIDVYSMLVTYQVRMHVN